jgi:Sulfotransferase domain
MFPRIRTLIKDPLSIPVSETAGIERIVAVGARNLYWGRTHGWANLLEEHDLNPTVRIPRDFSKWIWRKRFGVDPGTSRPVFVVGAQRSGTNMVTYGLDMAPEFEVHNEGDSSAFANYRLRGRERIAHLVGKSRHPFVLFKPLVESHLILQFLDGLEVAAPPRALWVYRGVRGRVRSAVAKFGESNLRVLRQYAADPEYRHWQLGDQMGLSEEHRSLLKLFDPDDLTPADGAALFWLTRNSLVFDLGLDQREDVLLVSYDAFVESPEPAMRRICDFLNFPFRPELVKHIRERGPGPAASSTIAQPILDLCDELNLRLDRAAR